MVNEFALFFQNYDLISPNLAAILSSNNFIFSYSCSANSTFPLFSA